MDSDAAEGSGTLNALYGSVANRQTRRAVNPFPSGVVGSTPTWPTIFVLETEVFYKLIRIK